jgi:hypothetical protein
MNTRHSTLAILAVLALATAGNLFAQRRTTSGGGSPGRSTPSGGGRSSGGRSSGGSQSGGNAGNGGGSAQPSARGQSSGGNQASGASSSTRPASGKIGAVKARARDVAARTRQGGGVIYGRGIYINDCWDCGYWGYYGPRYGWYDRGWWYPSRRHYPRDDDRDDAGDRNPELGQGYLPYPYAESDGTGETFVRTRTAERHSFGAISALYFNDVGSATQAGHVTLEGAIRSIHADIGYDHYAEPVLGGTDHLQTARFSVGLQPALGKQAYLIAGIGARGVFLGGGQNAGGPEGTLGVQLFPVRPLGINVTGRLAGLSWTGRDYFTMTELNTTGSVFFGRVELQAGWHWMKLEGSPAFAGPVVGTRLWF